MPCHDCSLLNISDSIPSLSVSNHAWFSKYKDKRIASSYTLCPHEYAYIQCCWGLCRSPSASTTTLPWEANKHCELESIYPNHLSLWILISLMKEGTLLIPWWIGSTWSTNYWVDHPLLMLLIALLLHGSNVYGYLLYTWHPH